MLRNVKAMWNNSALSKDSWGFIIIVIDFLTSSELQDIHTWSHIQAEWGSVPDISNCK